MPESYSREEFEKLSKKKEFLRSPEMGGPAMSMRRHLEYVDILRELEELKGLAREEALRLNEKYQELQKKAIAALEDLDRFETEELGKKRANGWFSTTVNRIIKDLADERDEKNKQTLEKEKATGVVDIGKFKQKGKSA